ncbi:flagellar basal-body rod protein FlgF [Rheinheimera aquimaris]|uniref:Flagellar basal-body rod protein FlgF n=1 Tax=Rheinheimera aquimaris TaxID=412437 RepID=A0ABN1D930_9GAMM|nr:flagellar basal-body rod protein FlgF [Rheinheimera aquimaris]MCB5212679.1 flagellar basal-body rod protein FlgF [Rheinheimera aquimaris]HBN89398.1 flagellar basal-body rod protein FlgF [Rheinheimera sp.]|tara:strand:- start:3005 stop:3751 length:747 start_codon:yes stop_codon:yes gene_type:complete
MDHLLYIAMSGAKENMNGMALRSNNLANASTTGFKADFEQARSMQAFGEGLPTRVFSLTERPGQNFDAGAIIMTERELDVAIQGDGWLAVQGQDGNEAYTRSGSLQISALGMLETVTGLPVLGDDGPIQLPVPLAKVEIAQDGTVSALPLGAPANAIAPVGRIKLVRPVNNELDKGTDGLFRRKDGQIAEASADVSLLKGALEGSNVNAVGEMTYMISLQRQFEIQVKMMKSAEEMDRQQNQLLRIVG